MTGRASFCQRRGRLAADTNDYGENLRQVWNRAPQLPWSSGSLTSLAFELDCRTASFCGCSRGSPGASGRRKPRCRVWEKWTIGVNTLSVSLLKLFQDYQLCCRRFETLLVQVRRGESNRYARILPGTVGRRFFGISKPSRNH